MNVIVRDYQETQDAASVGRLVADTYAQFNLSFAPEAERPFFLGPFQYAYSTKKVHQKAIVEILRASMVFVAEEQAELVGVLRGRSDRLHSLFVRADHHRRGIGRQLVTHFEEACRQQGSTSITLAATLYAVPFYLKLGYRKSTGLRLGRSFEGQGLPYQPMKKILGVRHLV